MAPHLIRAHRAYKDIRIHSFHHTHRCVRAHTHTLSLFHFYTHTHTNHTHYKYTHYWTSFWYNTYLVLRYTELLRSNTGKSTLNFVAVLLEKLEHFQFLATDLG